MADSTIVATITFARLSNGSIVAASTSSPYFCFEAPDEAAARKKVEEAFDFYIEAKEKLKASRPQSTERQITFRSVRPYSRQRKELAVA